MGSCANFKSKKITIINSPSKQLTKQLFKCNHKYKGKNLLLCIQQNSFYYDSNCNSQLKETNNNTNNIIGDQILENFNEESIHSFNSTEFADNDVCEEENKKKINYFNSISKNSCLKIFDFLQYKELVEVGKVNKKFNLLSKNSKVLIKFFQKRNDDKRRINYRNYKYNIEEIIYSSI